MSINSEEHYISHPRKRLMRILHFALVFLAVCFIIGHGVNAISEKALRDFPGDKVAGL